MASSCSSGGSNVTVMERSRPASNLVKSWGTLKLRMVGHPSPRTIPTALRIDVFPTPFGPTIAVRGSRGIARLSKERKFWQVTALIMANDSSGSECNEAVALEERHERSGVLRHR